MDLPGCRRWPRRHAFDALLLDMNFTPGADDGAEGLAALSQVLAIDDQAVVIPVTATAMSSWRSKR